MRQKQPAKLPNMILRGNVWSAVLRVPEDVRGPLGRSVYQQSTGENDIMKAWDKARKWLAHWKAEIDATRRGEHAVVTKHIDVARRAYQSAQAAGKDPWVAIEDALGNLGVEPDHHSGEDAEILPFKRAIVDQIDGTHTPFASRIDAWEGQLGMGSREASMYASDVRAFSKWHPTVSVEGLSGALVQLWIGTMPDLAPKTIDRKLSALRNFWGYLQAHEIAKQDNKPFHGRLLPRRNQADVVKRIAFTAPEITMLHLYAIERGDQILADLIWLAAHTGARIEELCSLTIDHVQWDTDYQGVITIPGTKTAAAARVVPVHEDLRPVVARLVIGAPPEGYLITSEADNRHGERSAPLSKRFGRLRDACGFTSGHVFHSIRKTVATLLEDAQCPEGIAADILGHDKPTMTYGLYSGGSSINTKRAWMTKAIHYEMISTVDQTSTGV